MSFKNTKEIYQALIDGKKIRQKLWDEVSYICLDENGNSVNESGEKHGLYLSDPERWEIYQEPKKKIKLYKYVYKPLNTEWLCSGGYYLDDHHFKNTFKPAEKTKWFKKENDFIEVEE